MIFESKPCPNLLHCPAEFAVKLQNFTPETLFCTLPASPLSCFSPRP